MKPSHFGPLTLFLSATLLSLLPPSSHALIKQLSDGTERSSFPSINDRGEVVWQCRPGVHPEICLYDGTTTSRLTNNEREDTHPRINDNGQVVWERYDLSDYEVFLYNGRKRIQLTNNALDDLEPQINNSGYVVWLGRESPGPNPNDEILLYNGTSVTSLAVNSLYVRYPRINNNGYVVWIGYDGSDFEIFLYDGTCTRQLTDNSFLDSEPQINDRGQVVWVGGLDFGAEIFLYDGYGTVRLTDNATPDREPRINDHGQVVWSGGYADGSDIFLYDGTSTMRLTENSWEDKRPAINNEGYVAWDEGNGSGSQSQIFLYDGASIVQLTNNSSYNCCAELNNLGHVVWQSEEEVFLATEFPCIPLADRGEYGKIQGGDQLHVNEVIYCFRGMSGDVPVLYQVYDVDSAKEVQIRINGMEVGYAALTANNNWGEERTVLLPDAYVNDGVLNFLTFDNSNNPPNLYWWGVRVLCRDSDGDGYGDPATVGCEYAEWDCDDSNPMVNPGKDETLDQDNCSDGWDNDCDGLTDLEEFDCVPCYDLDGDGYGDPGALQCAYPDRDCDDSDANVNPGAFEQFRQSTCSDGLDNDCDGFVDREDYDCQAFKGFCPSAFFNPLVPCCSEDSDCPEEEPCVLKNGTCSHLTHANYCDTDSECYEEHEWCVRFGRCVGGPRHGGFCVAQPRVGVCFPDFSTLCRSIFDCPAGSGCLVWPDFSLCFEGACQPCKGDCSIATAAFGSRLQDKTDVLRLFRDSYLLKHAAGRAFIRAYYELSPAIADYITARPFLRSLVRLLLLPLVGIVWLLV